MARMHAATCACMLALVCLVISASADDAPVDVCPANSRFKSLPFLKAAKPGALGTLLANGLTIDMAAVTDFIKNTLVPMIGANVFFFALAALLFIIFILWRLFRWCCVVCCCRGSCDSKREQNDPGELLFGQRMKIIKGFMFVFGLVAVAFAVYGLITVDKSVTDGAFNVLTTISDYATGAVDTLDHLLNTIKGTTTIITDFQAVVTTDINVDGIISNLTVIGNFLTNIPAPATLSASITALTTAVNPTMTNTLATLQNGITTFTTNINNPTWNNRFSLIAAQTSGTGISGMKSKADAVQTALGNIPSSGAPSNANADSLKTALDAMYSDISGANWVTAANKLNDLATALQNAVGTANPFATLRSQVNAVSSAATDVTTVKLPDLVTKINSLVTEYNNAKPSMAGLLLQLQAINSTILVLPPVMQTAYANLVDTKAKLDTVVTASPTPTSIASDLTSFSSSLPALTPLTNLVTNLNTAENNLLATYSAANTASYVALISSLSAAINGMVGSSLASGPLGALKAAFDTYISGGYTAANWDANVRPLQNAFKTKLDVVTGSTGFGSTVVGGGGIMSNYATSASTTASTTPSIATASVSTYVTNAQNTISSPGLPSGLSGSFSSNLGPVTTSFAALGSPPSSVVAEPKNQLQSIKTAAITSGNDVKSQILQTVNGFQGSTSGIKNLVVTQLGDIKANYQDTAKTYDGYRYTASMALYGISILFVVLILAASLANYHFGANISTILLLVITILYFLLALIIALLMSALYMGCNELEPLAVKLAPSQFTPLLRYYFYNEGDSVASVLKNANLVDINAVLKQVDDSKAQVLQGLTGNFTWVDNPNISRNPKALIGRINNTIDTAMVDVNALIAKAGRQQLFTVYSEVKGYLCCATPDMLAPMWTGLTMAGVFAVALIICTFFYISKIDHVPRKDCCGCTCHTRAKYAGSVYPNGGALPQYNTPGWEHPMGPYIAPNGAVAMQAPWMPDESTVNVVVQAPGGMAKAKLG